MERIIVTGSEGLIGKEVCRYLISLGHDVIKADLKLGQDFTNEKQTKDFFEKHKTSPCLINLFGMNHHIGKEKINSVYDVSLDSFRKYMDVNLTALWSTCIEYSRNTLDGKIVNFSSTYGLVAPQPRMYRGCKHPGYVVSKFGVIGLTKYLAAYLAPHIQVNCIVPGGVENNQSEEFIKEYGKRNPMQRMMRKTELNSIIEYLCFKNTYATGSVFTIDGGWTAW